VTLRSDLRAVRKLVTDVLATRRNRAELARERPAHPAPDPGSIEIAVYFADSKVNLYQIRQWYRPLEALATRHRVAIIGRAPSAVLAMWRETSLPVVYARSVRDLEEFIAQQPLKIVLYVNQNAKNFQMFRYGGMWHVFINHGESDKMYMTTNQFKAYDYAFVAGQAAIDRLTHALWDYDIDRRAIRIGRPQTDHLGGEAPFSRDDRVVVLYAPTWEGDRPAASYGSVASHGERLVEALLSTGRHRVVYRPHPRSGVADPEYARANRAIAAAIARANAADPSAAHLVDTGGELGWQLAVADVAITDISAMVYDRLATGRPIIVTRPAAPDADVDERGYLAAAEWLTAEDARDVVALVDRVLTDEAARERLAHWSRHHFGDTAPGASTARFHAAVDELIARWERFAAIHIGDERDLEADPDEAEDAPGE